MNYKRNFVAIIFPVLIFCCLGCGGGGGGGGGGSTSTTLTVAGSVDVPQNINGSWSASIRMDFSKGSLVAKATGKSGISLGDSAQVSTNGSFSLTIVPDDDVTVEVSNSKGFKFLKNLGKVAGSVSDLTVDATSTAEILYKDLGITDLPGISSASIREALLTALAAVPSLGSQQNIFELVKAQQTAGIDNVRKINEINTSLETALKNENIGEIMKYFSNDFGSTDPNLQSTINYSDFRAVTEDRFNRYNIITYSFAIQRISFPSDDTAKVVVNSHLSAQNVVTPGDDKDVGITEWAILWKLENGSWKIYRDFPYRSEQF